jgi:hypothetical protein
MRTFVLIALLLLAPGCVTRHRVPGQPVAPNWQQPSLGPEPTVYGPQPCNGPNCPRPRR